MSEAIVKAGTGIILVRDQRVLVGKRMGSHGEGLYAFPGGHIDPTDTSLKQAGEREVLEETAIVCDIYKPDGIRDDLFTTFDILNDEGTKRYVTSYLVARYVSGGDFLDEYRVKGQEPHKCDVWEFVTLMRLMAYVKAGGNTTWIPLDKVVPYLKEMGL